MKKSQKGNRNQKELKTKEQYKKAFEETHDLLKQEEKKREKCQKELEDLHAKLAAENKLPAASESSFASTQATDEADVKAETQDSEVEITFRKEPVENEIFREIKLLQERQPMETSNPLRAGRPFSLTTHLRFPVVPDEKNVDIDTHSYDVLVVATDERKNKIVARSGTADILTVGIRDYENTINMPALEAGKYRLQIYTLAPFARLKESKQLELSVQ